MKTTRLGYTIVWVADVEATVRFYEQAFGLERRTVQRYGDTVWAEMETGDTTLAFASETEAQTLFGPGVRLNTADQQPSAILLSFIVPEVESMFVSAIQHGASQVDAPKKEPWGQTVARLRDPNGVLISLATERAPG